MRKGLLSSLALILAITVIAPSSANPNAANGKGVPSANASGYWTEERRNNAIPREFQFEVGASEGKLVPQARKGGSGGGTTYPTGTTSKLSDTNSVEAKITGKVFFRMAGQDYVCSGSLIKDGDTSKDIVVTAAHCVWNNSKNPNLRGFATNWTFYPNYISTDKSNGYDASALFARQEFTMESSFSTTATIHDYAFAIIPDSGVLDTDKPSLGRAPNAFLGSIGNSFGYPQAAPYNGSELWWSRGEVSEDLNNGRRTWRIPSDMTGGASGGPWYANYSTLTLGTNVSVNSYKYSSDTKGMYGPKFDAKTLSLLDIAKTGSCAGSVTISCKTLP